MANLQLERTTKPAPDHDIEAAADEIMSILKDFGSPKDAGSALTLAHYKMLIASFPPENLKQAVEAVDADAALLRQLLNEGWN